jgi:hypothetical protein
VISAATVHVAIAAPALRKAVAARIGAELPVQSYTRLNGVGPGTIVVTTNHDVRPAECAALAARGLRVLILCALCTPADREAYQDAGAQAIVMMQDNGAELLETLHTFVAAGASPTRK